MSEFAERFNTYKQKRIDDAKAVRDAGRVFAPSVNDQRNNEGRFGLSERRAQEDAERVAAARRAEVFSLLSRTLGRTPTEAEIAEALQR